MADNSLGNRMKQYELASHQELTYRLPMIIRLDGRAFHTLTSGMEKPWDQKIRDGMLRIGEELLLDISGAKLAYSQSDEISVLVTDYDHLTTQPWFGKNVQKIVSVSASAATLAFKNATDLNATFDSRAFVLPQDDVCNYFVWRQQDAARNSIQSYAQSFFSPKQLHGLNSVQLQEKLFQEKEMNWNDLEIWKKRGVCIFRHFREDFFSSVIETDMNIPVFTQDRNYVERFVYLEEGQ